MSRKPVIEFLPTPDADAPPPVRRPRLSRLQKRMLAVAGLLVAALVAGGVWVGISSSYDGLRLGYWFGPTTGAPAHMRAAYTAEVGPSVFTLSGRTQLLDFPLQNVGTHPLTVNGISAVDDATTVSGWAVYRAAPNGSVHGLPSRTQPFPAHLAEHGTIIVRLVVHQPRCPTDATRYFDGRVVVHWHAMVTDHSTPIDPVRGNDSYLRLCPALR